MPNPISKAIMTTCLYPGSFSIELLKRNNAAFKLPVEGIELVGEADKPFPDWFFLQSSKSGKSLPRPAFGDQRLAGFQYFSEFRNWA